MCRALGVPRSMAYYRPKPRKPDAKAESAVVGAFNEGRGNYGTRKIKAALTKKGIQVSRRRIGAIMAKHKLSSAYTRRRKQRKAASPPNGSAEGNRVNREFNDRQHMEVIVSDLTYVRVGGKWNYVCLVVDLGSRGVEGFAAGDAKTGELVASALTGVRGLGDATTFHTDRGSEFKNAAVDGVVSAFGLKRSLSAKGTPLDNAVAESMYNIMKTETAFGKSFKNTSELELCLFDWVNWYNNIRPHGSLGYRTPSEYRGLLESGKAPGMTVTKRKGKPKPNPSVQPG